MSTVAVFKTPFKLTNFLPLLIENATDSNKNLFVHCVTFEVISEIILSVPIKRIVSFRCRQGGEIRLILIRSK